MEKSGFTLLECLLYISILLSLLPLIGHFHFHFQKIHNHLEKEINLLYEWQFIAKLLKEDISNTYNSNLTETILELKNQQETIHYKIKKNQLHRSSSPNYISLCVSKTFKITKFSREKQAIILHTYNEKNNISISL